MSLKVFISYSWKDKQATDTILAALSNLQQIDILIDRKSIEPGEGIHVTIDTMINAADLVVTNLTKLSLMSREVLDELTRVHDRGKKIIALVSEDADETLIPWFLRDYNQIRYSLQNFQPALNKLTTVIKNYTARMNNLFKYAFFNLSEKYSQKLVALGIIVANLGFFVWYFINRFLQWSIDSTGSPLVEWLIYSKDNFKGPLPAIWGVSSNWSIIFATILIIKFRFGKLGLVSKKWKKPTVLFLIFSAVAATIFYHSGIDELLISAKLHMRTIEFLSTGAWSIMLSTITISPFVVYSSSFIDVS